MRSSHLFLISFFVIVDFSFGIFSGLPPNSISFSGFILQGKNLEISSGALPPAIAHVLRYKSNHFFRLYAAFALFEEYSQFDLKISRSRLLHSQNRFFALKHNHAN